MARIKIRSLLRLAVIVSIFYTLYITRGSWVSKVSERLPKKLPKKLPGSVSLPSLPDIPSRLRGSSAGKPADIDYHVDLSETTPPCAYPPGAENVLLLIKTGATEIYQKLPIHLVTTLRCVPNVMIFSDLEQTFADYSVHDALKDVSPKLRDEHADFEQYRQLNNSTPMGGEDLVKPNEKASQALDKWKFLPMLHKGFEAAKPDIKWFVLIEADTSLSWLNLLHFLQRTDPKKAFYGGAPLYWDATRFAHGGSGIIVSRFAADVLRKQRQNRGAKTYDSKWEAYTAKSCCGDQVVGAAFKDVGITITPSWPLLQGETPRTLDWSSELWCAPAISWHNASPTEVNALWQFEDSWIQSHKTSKSPSLSPSPATPPPFLYRDVFDTFIAPYILPLNPKTINTSPSGSSTTRNKWNNLSSDRKFVHPNIEVKQGGVVDWDSLRDYEQASVKSPEACERACLLASEECVQWLFAPGRCHLGRVVRFGRAAEEEKEGLVWTSGWIGERIEKLRIEARECEVRWGV